MVLVAGVSATLAALTPRLKDFHQLLVDPPPVSHDTFLFPLILFLFLILVTVVYSIHPVFHLCPMKASPSPMQAQAQL